MFSKTQITCRLSVYPTKVVAGHGVSVVASSRRRGFFTPHIFSFASNGGKIRRTYSDDSCVLDTIGMAPGIYIVKAHVYQGAQPWNQADAEASFEVTESTRCTKLK
jgi:hypothetical protein